MRIRSLVLTAGMLGGVAVASAEKLDPIELFGQTYDVFRFDHAEQIQYADPFDPTQTLSFIEPEGAAHAGGDTLLVSSNEMAFFLTAKNHIVEVTTNFDGDEFLGVSFSRLVVVNDPDNDDFGGFDLDPGGFDLNTGETGLGAGGNVIVGNSEFQTVNGYDFQTGEQLEFPDGNCVDQGCGFSVEPQNTDIEDICYDTVNDVFITVNQEGPFSAEVFSTDGTHLSGFPIAGDANPSATGEPKGCEFVEDTSNLPASLQGSGSLFFVSLDDEGPALQVFDLDGNEIAYEPLTDGNGGNLLPTPNGTTLEAEGMAIDEARGVIYVFNQGAVFEDSVYFALVPQAGCPADCNGDGNADILDFVCFQGLFQAGDPAADCNDDGELNILDFVCFQTLFQSCF